nr:MULTISPECIES: coniferyl aldehyde dehydrogenase [unclassified Iodidimonas]
MASRMQAIDADQTIEAYRAAMNDVLAAQKKAFLDEAPVSVKSRINRLDRTLAILVDHQDALCAAMAQDFDSRPVLMSKFTDIASAVKALKFAKKHLRYWMQPEKRGLEFPLGLLGASGRIAYQPKGVVGVISPWNFPVNLTFAPLAGILAAGNRVMIKPSELTPATSALMEQLFGQYFDGEEISVITGGADVGQAFSSLAFDHLLFTGSTAVGRHVMRAAADNLVPVTLELGGKSPVIVSKSADLEQMAERVLTGKLMNAGQICLAPDYLLVPQDRMAACVEALEKTAARLYPQMDRHPDYTAIINSRHHSRLQAHIKDAQEKGARLSVCGSDGQKQPDDRASTTMPLYILSGVDDQMTVMRDELFGPILPLVGYQSIDEAIAYINAHDRPLGLYYFGRDQAEERHVIARTTSGGVTVNDVLWHVAHEDLPFGGIGPSGMGSYHGVEGFKSFSHARTIYRQTGFNITRLIGALPPYGQALAKTLRFQIRK